MKKGSSSSPASSSSHKKRKRSSGGGGGGSQHPSSQSNSTHDNSNSNSGSNKADHKKRKRERALAKSHGADVESSKIIWMDLLRKVKRGEDKAAAADAKKLFNIFKGKFREVAQRHDAARIVQAAFKHGTPEAKDVIVSELEEDMMALAKGKYSQYVVQAIVKQGSRRHRDAVIKRVKRNVVDLGTHQFGCTLIEMLFVNRDVCKKAVADELLSEFYGNRFLLLLSANKNGNSKDKKKKKKGKNKTSLPSFLASEGVSDADRKAVLETLARNVDKIIVSLV